MRIKCVAVAMLATALTTGCGDDAKPKPATTGGKSPDNLQMDPNSTGTKKGGGMTKPDAPKEANKI